MDRVIKFRGKRVDNGEWVYGYYSYDQFDDLYSISFYVEDGFEEYGVIPSTVGQFTGLHDKEGKEIYEDDICNVHVFTQELGENYGVRECEKEFVGVVSLGVSGLSIEANGFKDQIWYYDNFHEESLQVIGNVHDNPELLKQ